MSMEEFTQRFLKRIRELASHGESGPGGPLHRAFASGQPPERLAETALSLLASDEELDEGWEDEEEEGEEADDEDEDPDGEDDGDLDDEELRRFRSVWKDD